MTMTAAICLACERDPLPEADAPDWLMQFTVKGRRAVYCLPCTHAPYCAGCKRHAIADKTTIIQWAGLSLCKSCAGDLGYSEPALAAAPQAAQEPTPAPVTLTPAPQAAPKPKRTKAAPAAPTAPKGRKPKMAKA